MKANFDMKQKVSAYLIKAKDKLEKSIICKDCGKERYLKIRCENCGSAKEKF